MPEFDCHAHVYETTKTIGTVRYRPVRPAPLAEWLAHLSRNSIDGGVIVQPSFLGHDNEETLRAVEKAGPMFRAVIACGIETKRKTLSSLRTRGARGVRWNLVAGAHPPDPDDRRVRAFLSGLYDLGMHLQVQMEAERLRDYLPKLAPLVEMVVIDHFGLPQAQGPGRDWFSGMATAVRERLYVKLSAPYRSDVDPASFAASLKAALPEDRFVWGSDWPFTRFEGAVEAQGGYRRMVGWKDELQTALSCDFSAATARLYDL